MSASVAQAAVLASTVDSSSLVTVASVWRLLLTAGVVFVSYYVYRFLDMAVLRPYRRYRLLAQQGIKGPPFYPLIGNLLTLRRYHTAGRRLEFSRDNRDRFGSVHQFMLGPFNMLTMSDPDYVLAAWKAQSSHYHKGVLTKTMMSGLLGLRSLLLIDEPQHAKHRKMLAPAFHHARLQGMVSIMVAETQRKVDQLLATLPPASQAASSPPCLSVDVHRTFTELTFNIIMSSSFGNSLQTIPHASDTIARALTVTLPIVQKRQLALVEYLPVIRELPILGKQEAVDGVRAMDDVVMQMVRDRRAGRSHSNCPGEDLLDILLNARDPDTGECFADEQIRSDALTFVVAGHETTSSLMTWVIRDLSLRPRLWRRCREEVERVTEGGALEAHHLASLTLIDACIHESFRLRPPVPGISIQALDDHWLTPEAGKAPLFIPKDTNLGADIYCLQSMKELWGDTAGRYDEQRWIRGSARYHKPTHPAAFNGFSIGSRSCIGSQFAMLEAKVMTAMVVRDTDMEMVEGQRHDCVTQRLTIEPAFGLEVRILRAGQGGRGETVEESDDS